MLCNHTNVSPANKHRVPPHHSIRLILRLTSQNAILPISIHHAYISLTIRRYARQSASEATHRAIARTLCAARQATLLSEDPTLKVLGNAERERPKHKHEAKEMAPGSEKAEPRYWDCSNHATAGRTLEAAAIEEERMGCLSRSRSTLCTKNARLREVNAVCGEKGEDESDEAKSEKESSKLRAYKNRIKRNATCPSARLIFLVFCACRCVSGCGCARVEAKVWK